MTAAAGFDSSGRWAATEPTNLVWAPWDDSAAVLHRPSGKTHFLNAASVHLLEILTIAPVDALTAASMLAERESISATPQYVAQVETTLFRLGQLGLARRVTL